MLDGGLIRIAAAVAQHAATRRKPVLVYWRMVDGWNRSRHRRWLLHRFAPLGAVIEIIDRIAAALGVKAKDLLK